MMLSNPITRRSKICHELEHAAEGADFVLITSQFDRSNINFQLTYGQINLEHETQLKDNSLSARKG